MYPIGYIGAYETSTGGRGGRDGLGPGKGWKATGGGIGKPFERLSDALIGAVW